jgi:hypothetical protein
LRAGEREDVLLDQHPHDEKSWQRHEQGLGRARLQVGDRDHQLVPEDEHALPMDAGRKLVRFFFIEEQNGEGARNALNIKTSDAG